jgi:hypothetical protein
LVLLAVGAFSGAYAASDKRREMRNSESVSGVRARRRKERDLEVDRVGATLEVVRANLRPKNGVMFNSTSADLSELDSSRKASAEQP